MFIFTLALAHMALEEPAARYPTDGSSDNKACPCGVGENGRMCDVASDRSDPDRSNHVATYEPGETITMSWRETIGHSGRWRIAFDEDGASMKDFNNQILLDIPDPSGTDGNTGDGNLWEVEVTLPDVVCDNCTLQLVQIMDGEMEEPVPNPIGRSSYYQCADVELIGEEEPVLNDTAPYEGSLGANDGCGCSTTSSGSVFGAWLSLVVAFRRRKQA